MLRFLPKKKSILSILLLIILILSININCPIPEPDDDDDDHPRRCTLTVNIVGPGTVSPSDGKYRRGSVLTLTATPDSGYVFGGWSGDLSGNINPETLTMDSNKVVYAYFNQVGYGAITGTVVESVGGAPVVNTQVTAVGTGLDTTTDEYGNFTISGIPNGNRNILLSKSGLAGSILQSADISSDSTVQVNMVQTVYDFDPSELTPPTIEDPGISSGAEYSSDVTIDINVTPGFYAVQSTASHKSIYLAIGDYTGSYYDASSDNDALNFLLDVDKYPTGDLNIKIIAYDINNNRAELNVLIEIKNGSGSLPLSPAESDYYIEAATFGESLDLFRSRGDGGSPPPQDYTTWADFYVEVYAGTTGISVFRSDSQSGYYELAGKTAIYDIYNKYIFKDISPELIPGESVWYKISFFNEYGDGLLTNAIEVKVLDKYNLNQVLPTNYSTTTDRTPTFTWTSDPIPGVNRYDKVELSEVTGGLQWVSNELINAAQVTCGDTLTYNKEYSWVVKSRYEKTQGSVTSFSFPSTSEISNNGAFFFTVIEP